MKNSSSKQSGKMDMLHGSLLDKILLFAMPLAACSILQQLLIRLVLRLSGVLRVVRLWLRLGVIVLLFL